MNEKTYYCIASTLFLIIAVLHLLRVLYGWEAKIGEVIIPLWFSGVAAVLTGYLAIRGYLFATRK